MSGPVDWDSLTLAPLSGIFGEATRYVPATGAPFALTGVFDRSYKDLTVLDDDSAVATNTPVLGVRASDFAAAGAALPQSGDRVQIASVGLTYVVKTVEPDGHGAIKLALNLAATQP